MNDIYNESYEQLSFAERQELYSLSKDKEALAKYQQKIEKLIYIKKPPTPEEFIDPANGWLPEPIIAGTFPHIREEFCEILNQQKIVNHVVEYGATRLGKTYLARLLILYSIVFIHHLREPAMYYNLSPLTDLCIYLISFKFDKTRQLYLEPMYKIMRKSKKFKQVKMQDKVREEQLRLGPDVIVWSKASESGEITLASGLQIHLGNDDALSFIGGDVLQAYVSEIGFFCENAGATEDGIFRLYTDLADRIEATVGQGYLAYIYLDTSANNAESLIENHIIKDLQYRERTHFKWQSRWQARPQMFPIWQETKETFKVFTGLGSTPAKIIENEYEITPEMPIDLLLDVPIDAKRRFEMNLLKSIKDIAGRPTISENKFITDTSVIPLIWNNDTLQNVEGILYADSGDAPENLLWYQLKDKYFVKNNDGTYSFRRAPREPRFVGLDNAFSVKGDIMGLTVLHKEYDFQNKCVIYVADFCFAIGGREKGINLDAPMHFIVDLIANANAKIQAVFTDTFHSEGQKQFLERNRVEMIKQSVDREINPYVYLYSCMSNERIKVGKNIFLKNNLNALVRTRKKGKDNNTSGKEKIDHLIGPTENVYSGDFEHSTCGIFAKDVSDSLCQAVVGASTIEVIPTTDYHIENRRFSNKPEDINHFITDAFNQINKMPIVYRN